jgi:hypothetical protein
MTRGPTNLERIPRPYTDTEIPDEEDEFQIWPPSPANPLVPPTAPTIHPLRSLPPFRCLFPVRIPSRILRLADCSASALPVHTTAAPSAARR